MDRETVIKECGCKTFWVRGWDGFIRIIPVEKCEKHTDFEVQDSTVNEIDDKVSKDLRSNWMRSLRNGIGVI